MVSPSTIVATLYLTLLAFCCFAPPSTTTGVEAVAAVPISCNYTSFRSGAYEHNTTLSASKGYNIYWTVDQLVGVIYLALEVKTKGWIGFGIADPNGRSMPGADVVIAKVVNGVGSAEDRHTTGFTMPIMDDCGQDWVIMNAEETQDTTIIELARNLTATDLIHDRSIPPGRVNILWAFGTSDTLGYHGNQNRAYTSVVFYGDDAALPIEDDQKSIELLMNVSLPAQMTTYITMAFELPYKTEGPAHIFLIEPIIDPGSAHLVHHFFAYACSNRTLLEPWFTPTQYAGIVPGCDLLVYGWGLGGNALILPKEAGIPLKDSPDAVRFLMLQIHYNNPTLISGVTDHSGVRISYTKHLRQYDASMIILGDSALSAGPIPPGLSNYYKEFSCPSQCTAKWPHDITVFGDWLHMHMIGNMGWGTRWDANNTFLGYTTRAEYFAFDKQQIADVNFKIKRGDRINSHCVWDSRGRSEATQMGEDSNEEMCFEVLFYYPAIPKFNFCGLSYMPQVPTICGSIRDLMPVANPQRPDTLANVNKTWGAPTPPCATGASSRNNIDEVEKVEIINEDDIASFAPSAAAVTPIIIDATVDDEEEVTRVPATVAASSGAAGVAFGVGVWYLLAIMLAVANALSYGIVM
eukprot:TRINITY_DN85_c0_g2_i1.p1 TRINITY_DN85_c0_g2~~TRINITY_DN85_c0_g2_i1.p1  ORF type:complete len:635 (-),score=137.14 TRINITY_DN85_c0_g2_i1:138-2042(-)